MSEATGSKGNKNTSTCILHESILGFMARFGELPWGFADEDFPCDGMQIHHRADGGFSVGLAKNPPRDLCKECVGMIQGGGRPPAPPRVAPDTEKAPSTYVESSNHDFISRLIEQVGEQKFTQLVCASGSTTRDAQNLLGALQYGADRFDSRANQDVIKKLSGLGLR